MLNKKSVTLVEVMVAMVIMATCVAGMYATFIAGRKAVSRSKRKLIAMNAARQVAESLKSSVRQDTYNTGYLACSNPSGIPCSSINPFAAGQVLASQTFPSSLFNGSAGYVVTNIQIDPNKADTPDNRMRRVQISVTWDEPNP